MESDRPRFLRLNVPQGHSASLAYPLRWGPVGRHYRLCSDLWERWGADSHLVVRERSDELILFAHHVDVGGFWFVLPRRNNLFLKALNTLGYPGRNDLNHLPDREQKERDS